MTGRQLANRIGAMAIGSGLLVGAAVWFLEPTAAPAWWSALAWYLCANAAVAVVWGIHLLVTRRPW